MDLESPEEYSYYENFEALIEEEEHIEEALIREIIAAADSELLSEHINNFFDAFQSNIPDEEKELFLTVEAFKNNMSISPSSDLDEEAISKISSEIYAFRKWYVIEHHARDEDSGEDISVRDARYEIAAAKLLGEEISIDFGRAVLSGPDAYEVRIRDIIE
ncbi:MAG: hypothetical protein IKE52_03980 [Mogibacterium sp.]|nr:hypothetical protein [Mogibacterium sp.]